MQTKKSFEFKFKVLVPQQEKKIVLPDEFVSLEKSRRLFSLSNAWNRRKEKKLEKIKRKKALYKKNESKTAYYVYIRNGQLQTS